MTVDLKALQERRSKAAAEIRQAAEKFTEGKGWESPEAKTAYDEANQRYDAVMAEMDQALEHRDIAAREEELRLAEEGDERRKTRTEREQERESGRLNDQEARALVMQGWCRANNGLAPAELHLRAAKQVGVDLFAGVLEVHLPHVSHRHLPPVWTSEGQMYHERRREVLERELEQRAQAAGTDNVGGYLCPPEFMRELEMAQLYFNGPRSLARVITTLNGNDMEWPSIDDTSNSGENVAENAAVNEQAVAVGSRTLKAYKRGSGVVLVSEELMEDSAWAMGEVINPILAERLARRQAAQLTTGTGSSQPQGVAVGATTGKTAAATNAITADELIDLQHSVDVAYRTAEQNCGWMMHDNIILALRKLKDSTNQYLWQPGLQAGAPDRLLGFPVAVNNNMASSMAANALTVLFGAFRKFVVREVRSIRYYRLEERYRDNDQTGFVAFHRYDSRVLDAGTNPIKVLKQAAS